MNRPRSILAAALLALAPLMSGCASAAQDGRLAPEADPRDTFQRQVDCGAPETVAWMLADGESWMHDACCASFRDSLAPHLHHDTLRLTHDLRARAGHRGAVCATDENLLQRKRILSGVW